MSHEKGVENVRDQLRKAQVRPSYFIPRSHLAKILSSDVIYEIVRVHDYSLTSFRVEQVWKAIEENGRKTFATLLLANAEKLVPDLFEKSFFDDNKLPRLKEDLESFIANDTKISLFLRYQFMVNAPIFVEGWPTKRFADNTAMPFLRDDPISQSSQGQNGFVSVVTIPLDHLELGNESDMLNIQTTKTTGEDKIFGSIPRVKVARKELVNNSEGDAKRECRQHGTMHHKSLLPLFAAYEYKGKLNLLLPYYRTTLSKFLRDDPDDRWTDSVYIDAMYNLLEAVDIIHNPINDQDRNMKRMRCHCDIKLENILVDDDEMNFILADFGHTKTIDRADGSNFPTDGINGIHSAPECREKQEYRPQSDIWSLGCIFLEITIYRDKPSREVLDKFKTDRRASEHHRTESTFHRFGKEKAAVVNKLRELGERANAKSWRQLIELISDMLKIDYKERPSAAQLVGRLGRIRKLHADAGNDVEGSTRDHTTNISTVPKGPEQVNSQQDGRDRHCNDFPQFDEMLTVKHGSTRDKQPLPQTSSSKYCRVWKQLLPYPERLKEQGRLRTMWTWSQNGRSLQKWAKSEKPEVLLFHSYEHEGFEGPISCLAAHIVEDAERSNLTNLKRISYFCASNNFSSKDNALRLAKSLLAQLVENIGASKTVGDSNDISEIMESFKDVFKRLPPTLVLVCVIDRLDFCNEGTGDKTWMTKEVVRCLLQLVTSQSIDGTPRLKLILTIANAKFAHESVRRYSLGNANVLAFEDGADGQALEESFWKENRLDWR